MKAKCLIKYKEIWVSQIFQFLFVNLCVSVLVFIEDGILEQFEMNLHLSNN